MNLGPGSGPINVVKTDGSPYIHGGGGNPPGGDPLEARVSVLEKKFDKIEAKLDSIGSDLSFIKGKIDVLPSAAAIGELKGRVDSLPTLGKIATLIGLATGAIAIINNWSMIKSALLG